MRAVTPAGSASTADLPTGFHTAGSASAIERVRQPKYYALKRHLLEITESLPPGAPVPAERTLADDFDTSRTTVRQALAELAMEGHVERVQGKGTFVSRPKVAQTLQLTSYTEDMDAQGLAAATRLLDVSKMAADARLARSLEIRSGSPVLRIERLRLADGEPMAIETTHLPMRRFRDLRRHVVEHASLYRILTEIYGVRLADADETIETKLASRREAELLAVEVGQPMLRLSRHARDVEGVPVEWVHSVYRGDRYKLVARLYRPA